MYVEIPNDTGLPHPIAVRGLTPQKALALFDRYTELGIKAGNGEFPGFRMEVVMGALFDLYPRARQAVYCTTATKEEGR